MNSVGEIYMLDEALELYEKGCYKQALKLARSLPPTQGGLVAAMAALALGDDGLAESILEQIPSSNKQVEAERMSILGLIKARRGEVDKYRELAIKAANSLPTSLTLYHLGLALPPREAILPLREAVARADSPKEEARIAFSLSWALRRSGALEEALSFVALARLRDPNNPFYISHWAHLVLLTEKEVPFIELEQIIKPLLKHEAKGVRWCAATTFSILLMLQGKVEASTHLLDVMLSEIPKVSLPYYAPLAVLLFRSAGKQKRGLLVAQAAGAVRSSSSLHTGLSALAMGLAKFPSSSSEEFLKKSIFLLSEEMVLEAAISAAHLMLLKNSESNVNFNSDHFRRVLLGLPTQLLELFLPWPEASHFFQGAPYVKAFGEGKVYGLESPGRVRSRSLELLVLLLSKPGGWESGALAEALYGKQNYTALKTEISRLRKILGGGVSSRPYRVTRAVKADFLDLVEYLKAGNLPKALALYQGPLLQKSGAPGIETLRWEIEEELRRAIIANKDTSLLLELAERIGDDLEIWELALDALSPNDPRYPAVLARIERLQREYAICESGVSNFPK